MKSRVRRELKWFFGAFIAPMLLLIGTELALSRSKLPLWRRVVTLEDTCAYGSCFILPAVVWIVVLGLRTLWNEWQRFLEARRGINSHRPD
jgi:hypothetical protein